MNILCADGTAILRIGGISVPLTCEEAAAIRSLGVAFTKASRRFRANEHEFLRRPTGNQHRSRRARRRPGVVVAPVEPPNHIRRTLLFDVTYPDGHTEQRKNLRQFLIEEIGAIRRTATRVRRNSIERAVKRKGFVKTKSGVYTFTFHGLV